jgi:hypothetical protein
MQTYKAQQNLVSYFKNFSSLVDAENYFYSALGNDCTVELASPQDQIPVVTPVERLQTDIEFGNQLINTFLEDNRNYGYISLDESIVLLNKFNNIEKLCRLGSIKDVQTLMQNVITDNIFTQERKDKYLQMITNYLNSYL